MRVRRRREGGQGGGGGDSALYRSFSDTRQKIPGGSVTGRMKTEAEDLDLVLDPMIEPISGTVATIRKLCPVTVGTNTDITPEVKDSFVDEIEEDMEPVRYRANTTATIMQVREKDFFVIQIILLFCLCRLSRQSQNLPRSRPPQ